MGNAGLSEKQRLEAQRVRADHFRERRRRGALLVSLEVERTTVAALERLALLDQGERDPQAVAAAVTRFLAAAEPVAQLGAVLQSPAG